VSLQAVGALLITKAFAHFHQVILLLVPLVLASSSGVIFRILTTDRRGFKKDTADKIEGSYALTYSEENLTCTTKALRKAV
jgi:hypothetical protein